MRFVLGCGRIDVVQSWYISQIFENKYKYNGSSPHGDHTVFWWEPIILHFAFDSKYICLLHCNRNCKVPKVFQRVPCDLPRCTPDIDAFSASDPGNQSHWPAYIKHIPPLGLWVPCLWTFYTVTFVNFITDHVYDSSFLNIFHICD